MKHTKGLLIPLSLMLVLLFAFSALAQGTLSKDDIAGIVQTTTDPAKVTSPVLEVAKNARQSVVGINNYQVRQSDYYGYGFGYFTTPSQGAERLRGTGSGVVVSPWGHIITNNHVIDEATRVTVTFEKQEFPATVVASDAALDIAILHAPDIKLPHVPLGDSDQVQVGEYAIVIGNPLGQEFERSVTVGFVSALNREVTDKVSDRYGRYATVNNQMIQVDAAINQGNSGGGMFNTLGQLQGIPSRKYDNNGTSGMFGTRQASIDNIGMVIPINVAKPMLEEVLKNYDANAVEQKQIEKSAPRPRLGVTVKTLGPQDIEKKDGTLPNGAYVVHVEEGSPAMLAGIKAGDIIVDVDGTVVNNSSQLVEITREHKEGDVLKVKVFRIEGEEDLTQVKEIAGGQYLDMEVTLQILDDVKM